MTRNDALQGCQSGKRDAVAHPQHVQGWALYPGSMMQHSAAEGTSRSVIRTGRYVPRDLLAESGGFNGPYRRW